MDLGARCVADNNTFARADDSLGNPGEQGAEQAHQSSAAPAQPLPQQSAQPQQSQQSQQSQQQQPIQLPDASRATPVTVTVGEAPHALVAVPPSPAVFAHHATHAPQQSFAAAAADSKTITDMAKRVEQAWARRAHCVHASASVGPGTESAHARTRSCTPCCRALCWRAQTRTPKSAA